MINADIDKKEVIASLRAFRQRTGRFPTWRDCNASARNGVCHRSEVRKSFGTFQEAYVAAFPTDHSERRVVINGEVCLYEAKAPYEKSGESIRGAIEYDASSESMKCHECGGFFRDLGSHIRRHSISGREYKIKHGLRSSSALANDSKRIALSDASRKVSGMADSESASHKMRAMRLKAAATPITAAHRSLQSNSRSAGNAELRNSLGGCSAQCLEKLRTLADTLGRTPYTDELVPNGISEHYLRYHFGTTSKAMEIAGLLPRRQGSDLRTPGRARVKRPLPQEFLVRQLRVFFYNHKRIPRSSDLKRGFFTAGYYRFRQHWGSWREAIEVAFSPKEIDQDRFWARKCATPYAHPAQP